MSAEQTYATYGEARAAVDAELADFKAALVDRSQIIADRLTEAAGDLLPPGVRFAYDLGSNTYRSGVDPTRRAATGVTREATQ